MLVFSMCFYNWRRYVAGKNLIVILILYDVGVKRI